MRQDKLTTKFQEALSQAQSLALANDNQFIEPVHVLSAMLDDPEGGTVSLVERAGGNAQQLKREAAAAVKNLPKVTGTNGDVQISRDLARALNLTERKPLNTGMNLFRPKCSFSRRRIRPWTYRV